MNISCFSSSPLSSRPFYFYLHLLSILSYLNSIIFIRIPKFFHSLQTRALLKHINNSIVTISIFTEPAELPLILGAK